MWESQSNKQTLLKTLDSNLFSTDYLKPVYLKPLIFNLNDLILLQKLSPQHSSQHDKSTKDIDLNLASNSTLNPGNTNFTSNLTTSSSLTNHKIQSKANHLL
jgi:hypothetical protein